jgi:hypothetical protein
VYVCVICITCLFQEEEGPEVLRVKEEGCEEGLGNPVGTMVMEDRLHLFLIPERNQLSSTVSLR